MFSLNKKVIILVLSSLVIGGCSSETKKTDLDQQVKAQPVAATPEQIAQQAAETFSSAPGLTPEQKQKLMVIYSKTYGEAIAIRSEIGQSKSLLFKKIASAHYKSAEVSQLKKQITKLDEKRLGLMFRSLEEIQAVVGYGTDKDEIYKHMRDFEFPQHGNL
jgi:outer membrane murein-binding lipoprotein Lpp